MKILITGANGFIGTNLRKSIKGHTLDLWDKTTPQLDIFNPEFENAVSKADAVIHLAALTSVSQSFKKPEEVYFTNVLGTARVAQFCAMYNKKLVYPSSAAVYFPDLSPYAMSKKIAEDIVRNTVPNAAILRLFNVFGPNMNPDSGSVMYNFLTAKKKIVIFGDGEQTRDFVHVRDVCMIMQDALKNKWRGKIVDVGTGQAYSTNYIAGLFAHFRGLKMEYEPPRREIKWSIANTDVLKSLYSKKLTTNLEEDIKELAHGS